MSNLKDVKSKIVEITLLDGVKRTLKYDLNAMAELEDKYGNVEEAFNKLEKGSFKAIRSVLWVGLLHEDASLTEQQVGSLIDLSNLQSLTSVLSNALDSDMPVEDNKDGTVLEVVNPN